jgi:hypothetical protein
LHHHTITADGSMSKDKAVVPVQKTAVFLS